jgi:hypothetical protein
VVRKRKEERRNRKGGFLLYLLRGEKRANCNLSKEFTSRVFSFLLKVNMSTLLKGDHMILASSWL